jgi:hypothetical protein
MALVAQTENFVFETAGFASFHDDFNALIEARSLAQALAASGACETDLATLQKWFGAPGGFGTKILQDGTPNKITVLFDPTILPKALGFNQGYPMDGKTKPTITLVPFTGASAQAATMTVFAAELAEIFMDYRNQLHPGKPPSWIANNSMGEALSTVCEGLLHPDGYYNPVSPPLTTSIGPRIWQWLSVLPHGIPVLSLVRQNWIDKTENSDQNYVSFGCGIVFLYYLLSQRAYSMEKIIASGGATFEETYRNLTGQSGAWAAFSQLLERYFPSFPNAPFGTIYRPSQDNLFPLPVPVSLKFTPVRAIPGVPTNHYTGRITLDSRVQGAALKISLFSEDAPALITLPPNPVAIQTGFDFVEFEVTVTPSPGVFRTTTVTVSASFYETTVAATITFEPPVTGGVLKSLTLNPATVTGGNTSQGLVTLEAAVAQDTHVGLAALQSGGGPGLHPGGESDVASVDPTVTVRHGSTEATFIVNTSDLPPHVKRSATIIAGAGGVTKRAVLTVEGA